MRNSYTYPAIFTYAEDGISIEFPDLPGCLSCGCSDDEAMRMAADALELHLWGMEQDGEEIPEPTPANNIHVSGNQVVVLIRANMALARMELNNRAVKKTLTIPQWLNQLAEARGVNFSLVLQEALKDYLGITNHAKKAG